MANQHGYKKILVGTDFSEAAVVALDEAVDLAKRLGARIDLVHVVEEIAPAPWTILEPETIRRLKKRAIDEAQEAVAKTAAAVTGVSITGHVLTGPAHSKLLSFAKRSGADFIVLANVGRSRLVDVLVGSTAQRMVGRATVPLLLVPARGRGRGSSRSPARREPAKKKRGTSKRQPTHPGGAKRR